MDESTQPETKENPEKPDQCQKCGEHIGWLDRLIRFFRKSWHKCRIW